MGSAVSCKRSTKVAETALQKPLTSERKKKNCTNIIQSSLHQNQKSDGSDTPSLSCKSEIVLPPPDSPKLSSIQTSEEISREVLKTDKDANDDKNAGTAKDENVGNTEIDDTMTDIELELFRSEMFKMLRKTAMEVVALETRLDKDGSFVPEISSAAVLFHESYFMLKETGRANIENFRWDIAQLIMETKYLNLSCEIVVYVFKNGWHLEYDNEDEGKSIPLYYTMYFFHNFSDISDDFAIALANESEFLQTMKQMLKHLLQENFGNGEESEEEESEKDLLDSALGIIHNMSMRESNVSKLRDADMITYLKPYLKSSINRNAMGALASLAGIINEDECDIINSNKHIVVYLLDCLRRGLKDNMRRWEGWSCKECGFTIKLLARNDANVKTLTDLGALELLVELGRTGDEEEQYESVSALWALSFDKKVKALITEKQELGVVELLVDLKSSKNEKIKKACNGALWTLSVALNKTVVEKYKKLGEQFGADREKTSEEKKKQPTSEDKLSSKGHVMISYQWADQEVLKKVHDNINAMGYPVWMDIYQMGGSTLQAMADAVEGAAVFLLCMSNKYKHSPTCRAEAEYAFQLRKNIIPLKMERGYNPDGWLGFIVGSKLFFEFSPKYPFKDKMKALLKEIDSTLGGARDIPDSGEILAPQIATVTEDIIPHSVVHADTASPVNNTVARISLSKTTFDNVSKWNADEVKKWIERNDLQKCRIGSLTCGEIALLASMRLECPEFFYKCLQDTFKIKDFLTMSKIVSALHELS